MRMIGAVLLCCLWLGAWSAETAEPLADFDIRAQPLASALLEFSGQSGIQVLAADARLVRRQVRGVRGRMPATTALRQLLAGTGISFRRIDAGTIALVRAAAADTRPERPSDPAPAGEAGPAP